MTAKSPKKLERHPRPLSAQEAAELLNVTPGQFAALNLPVVKVVDGVEVYDSKEVAHWLRIRRVDPVAFEQWIAAYDAGPPHP